LSEFHYKAIGYHGCVEAVAEKIGSDGVDAWDESKAGWLGPGIYFWDNDRGTGLWWAKHVCDKNEGESPALIKALINLDGALDLTNVFGQNVLKRLHNLTQTKPNVRKELDAVSEEGMSPIAALVQLAIKRLERKSGRTFSSIRVPVHMDETHDSMETLFLDERGDESHNGSDNSEDDPNLGLTVGFRMVILVKDKKVLEAVEVQQ